MKILTFLWGRVKRLVEERRHTVRLFVCSRCKKDTQAIVGTAGKHVCPGCYDEMRGAALVPTVEQRARLAGFEGAPSFPAPCKGGPRSALLPSVLIVLLLAFVAAVGNSGEPPKPKPCEADCVISRDEAIAEIVRLEKKYGTCEISRRMHLWLMAAPGPFAGRAR